MVIGIILFFLASTAMAQEEQKEEIFLGVFLKPKLDKISAFEAALKEHNNKFHQDFPVFVAFNQTGELAGYYGNFIGPYSWAEWEDRQTTEAHDTHWIDEVLPLVEDITEASYWERRPKFETNPLENPSDKSIVTIITVKDDQGNRFRSILERWNKANQESDEFDGSYNVYFRWFDNPEQVAIVGSLENGLAEFGEDNGSPEERFEEVHGEGSWDLWQDDVDLSVKSVDEVLRIHRPDLSTETQ